MKPETINENWAFEADENCVTLLKIQTKQKTGEKYFRPAGYYVNIQQLFTALVDKEIQNLEKLELISEKIEELKAIIKKYMCTTCSELFLKDFKDRSMSQQRAKKQK